MYIYMWSFFIFAFVGWVSEVAFAAIRQKQFVNRGFLNGPLCPIYGFGVVLMDFCLEPISKNIALLLIGAMILGSALEWFAGFLLEKFFHQKWWDYSDKPHNLNGYVCLKFSVVWGFAGALIVKGIMPVTKGFIDAIPHIVGWILLAILLAVVIADFAVTVISITGLNRKLSKLQIVSDKIKEGSNALGEKVSKGAIEAKEKYEVVDKKIQKESVELKEKYELAIKNNKAHSRLLKAFPDLKSLKYNEQLDSIRDNFKTFKKKSSEVVKKHNTYAVAAYETKIPKGKEAPFANGLCFSKLFWIFMIGNVVGFLLETSWCLITPPHKFELRVSLVFGPFILVYGLGAVLLTLCLYKLYKQKEILIFIASMVIGGAFEYVCSFVQQAAFGTVSWEYSASPLNIGGRTNLMYSVFWGILGVVWLKDLYPALSRLIEKIPKKLGKNLTIIVFVFILLDSLLSIGAVARQSQRVDNIPATDGVARFFDKYFDDDFLKIIYPNMRYVGRPDIPKTINEEAQR
ncbi:MAG: putative ABC transporter permease, partial [Clostridia bacterium]